MQLIMKLWLKDLELQTTLAQEIEAKIGAFLSIHRDAIMNGRSFDRDFADEQKGCPNADLI